MIRRTLLYAGACLAASFSSQAIAQPKTYKVPAQSLAGALRDFALQGGEQVLFVPSALNGKYSKGVNGTYEPDMALSALLEGSRLRYSRKGAAFVISPSEAAVPRAPFTASREPAQGGMRSIEPASSVNLGEIVVTAQRRAERLQDVPASLSVVNAEALKQQDVASFSDLARSVPGLNVSRTGAFTQPTLRGIGATVTGFAAENNVALYIDGFYYASMASNVFNLQNIDHIEVLKGPQGTLFGRNATGGAILVVTKDPSFKPVLNLTATAATYDDDRVGAYGSIGVTDNLAIDLAAFYREADGYTKDLRDGFPSAPLKEQYLRSNILYRPTDTFQVKFSLQDRISFDATGLARTAIEGNSGARALARAAPADISDIATQPHVTSMNFNPRAEFLTRSAHLSAEWDLRWGKLTSRTQDDTERQKYASDLDYTYVPLVQDFRPWYATSDIFTQEFNLAGSTQRLDWVSGVYYFRKRADQPYFVLNNGASNRAVKVFTDAYAAYADATYKITGRLAVTLGARYGNEKNQIEERALPGGPISFPHPEKLSFDAFTPRAAIRYEINPGQNVYASVGKGFKSGFVERGQVETVGPEKILAYEAGYKIARGNFRGNLSAFYYDYSGLQITVFDLRLGSIMRTLNAAKAKIKGVEGDIYYAPNEFFNLTASASYLDATYSRFPGAVNFVPLPGGNRGNAQVVYDGSGQRLLRTPEVSANISAEVLPPSPVGKLSLSASYYYQSEISFMFSGRIHQPAYGLLGARAKWTTDDDRYSVALFAQNLTDKDYIAGGSVNNQGDFMYYGPPRVVGVTVESRF